MILHLKKKSFDIIGSFSLLKIRFQITTQQTVQIIKHKSADQQKSTSKQGKEWYEIDDTVKIYDTEMKML